MRQLGECAEPLLWSFHADRQEPPQVRLHSVRCLYDGRRRSGSGEEVEIPVLRLGRARQGGRVGDTGLVEISLDLRDQRVPLDLPRDRP
jgi:hypothetical protein